MRKISDTIERLSALRAASALRPKGHGVRRLIDFPEFGSNPGALRARIYLPKALPHNAPLIVVLHGCTQTAEDYDHGVGWSRLADQQGFALLFPEQQRANNANLCFNWFLPGDIQRDYGEALSIRQMIEAVVATYSTDRRRIFVTGLSAGGAMTSVMLAAYPEIFAGGAILAGLPYGCASTVPEAFDRMRGHGVPHEQDLRAMLRSASRHQGPWPTISVWQGTADKTVAPSNADDIVAQWRGVHEALESPDQTTFVDGFPRRVWLNADGCEVIENYSITGMGHGTPLAAKGIDGLGAPGPFMIEMGISSTRQIARFWHLASSTRLHEESKNDQLETGALLPTIADRPNEASAGPWLLTGDNADHSSPKSSTTPLTGVRKVIEDALRAAGLMN